MAFIGCAARLHLHRKKKLDMYSVSLRVVNATLKLPSLGSRLKLGATKDTKAPRKNPHSCKDPDPCMDPQDPRLLLPEDFHEFLNVFEKGKAQELPPHLLRYKDDQCLVCGVVFQL